MQKIMERMGMNRANGQRLLRQTDGLEPDWEMEQYKELNKIHMGFTNLLRKYDSLVVEYEEVNRDLDDIEYKLIQSLP